MNYLLDSNVVSDFYDKNSSDHDAIAHRLGSLNDEDRVFISIITLYELEYGYNNAPEDKRFAIRKKINEAKEDFGILPLTIKGSMLFGRLKKSLVNKRNLKKGSAKKHNIDVILASTAIINSCTLVSADRIYTEIKQQEPRLKIDNWMI
ncbi:type II toxin-antitoxin system VapC family toxin [Candidatus Thiosymbion oneisti]|uniref:type II toxin-antitoxin system VapC family toxin n=1 Tax=Candidatus Thiosymbion oneisti TaxID=589554 RepID=UPI0010607EE5|nr:type II toxin-antitoxin system VapC family toxin [Candidatus Thiosymbion oneisti]